jgi:DNA-binding transcriptional regulator YdaS (Cro superfamily)
MSTQYTPLEKAIALFNNPTRLAAAIGYSQHAVWHALNRRGQVSARMAVAIERATKGQIRREQLRPDIFGAA